MGLLIIGTAPFRRLKALNLLARLHPPDSHRRRGTALRRRRIFPDIPVCQLTEERPTGTGVSRTVSFKN